MISFIIVARDEPPQLLEVTIEGLLKTSASYEREIIIVDDGSYIPVALNDPDLLLFRRPESTGTAKARRYGVSISSGNVIVTMDAHMRFAPDWLDRMLAHVDSGALLCASWWDYDLTHPLCWGADFLWCGERNYSVGKSPGFAFRHRTKYPGKGAVEVPMMIGACYMMLRSSYDRFGGFSPFFRTWGKQEQDISLRAWLVGLEVKCVTDAHVGHYTRSKHPYPVTWQDVEFNQVVTVRTTFDEPVARTIEELLQPLPSDVQNWLTKVDLLGFRLWIQSHRCLSDAEFIRRFVPDAPQCLLDALQAISD
jgi:glycosyltransferase involved in cell wall biosynthesis